MIIEKHFAMLPLDSPADPCFFSSRQINSDNIHSSRVRLRERIFDRTLRSVAIRAEHSLWSGTGPRFYSVNARRTTISVSFATIVSPSAMPINRGGHLRYNGYARERRQLTRREGLSAEQLQIRTLVSRAKLSSTRPLVKCRLGIGPISFRHNSCSG